ncbi:glycosyl hydrolase family 28 protein [Paraflavisolibacter sp. H34]|uniref:glycoside hydrolase family 28 protein n=1 Tax=Huijunlia imazamoxiresistens TaxID=3127457 RepID=UPI00301AE36B
MPLLRLVFLFLFCQASFGARAKDYPASLFGIHSDGRTLNTRSIQFAIDYIHGQGGGRLVFDVGRFLTGSLHLKSNVTLHLLEGAVLLGATNPFDYDRKGYTALVLAHDQENIAITGKGVIDGQGREVARQTVALVHKGLVKDLFRNDRPEVEIRPMLVYFRSCRRALVRGVTLRNAAAWVQTYDQCRNLRVDSITVDSRAFWNNDGIDLVDCDSVAVTHAYINSADDGICLKSHDPARLCRNILIRDCTLRSSANAIKLGTASLGGFQSIRIRNIRVYDTYRSALALEAVDGGFIEDVTADSLQVVNTGNLLFLRIGERVSGRKGRLERIRVRHVQAEIAAGKPDAGYEYEGPVEDMPRNISPAVILAGLPGAPIRDIVLEQIDIQHPGGGDPFFARAAPGTRDSVVERAAAYPEFSMFRELPAWAVYMRHAREVRCVKLSLDCEKKDYRPAVVVEEVQGVQFTGTAVQQPGKKKELYQQRSSGVLFR